MSFAQKFRILSPVSCAHAQFLNRYSSLTESQVSAFVNRANAALIKKDVARMESAFSILIKAQLKSAGINFVIKNLPATAERCCDDELEPVSARCIHDTLKQFGHVNDAVVYKNHAYVWFDKIDDSKHTHSLVNNMLIGNKIVSSSVIA